MVINDIKEFGEKPLWRGLLDVWCFSGQCIMVIWELSVLKRSEQHCLELPQSLHSYISLQENEGVGGMKFWGAELFEWKQLLQHKGQKMSRFVFLSRGTWQRGAGGVWRGERGWWVTSVCAVPSPSKTRDQPQTDVSQPSHAQPVTSCTFLCFLGLSKSESLEKWYQRLSWHQSTHALLASAAQHLTKPKMLMATWAGALAGLVEEEGVLPAQVPSRSLSPGVKLHPGQWVC